MEAKHGSNGGSGFMVKGYEASQTYRLVPSVQNTGGLFGGSTLPPTSAPPQPRSAGATSRAPAQAPLTEARKKRGRPRKGSGDGSAVALSPMPISASIPFSTDYAEAWNHGATTRPVDTFKNKHKLEFEKPGQPSSYPFGRSFIPHMVTVNNGEDIMMKIISFSQEGSRAICILAANGTISNVTLRQSNSSGGTLTYEGCFEILSLTGSFMPSDNGLTKNRSGGLSVSLAGPNGRVLGGGLAGMLVAAGPVQIVIGSFPLPGTPQHEQRRPKKPIYEQTISFTPVEANPISEHRYETPPSYHGPKPNLTPSASFHLANSNSAHGPKTNENLKGRTPGGDSREPNREITC